MLFRSNDTATTEIYTHSDTLSLHDALPISMHGGALMGLADTLGGLCAYLNLPAGAGTATISSSTVFTRALRGGEVRAVTRPLHVGRTVITVQTDLSDEAGRRVAQVTQVQAVLGGDGGR